MAQTSAIKLMSEEKEANKETPHLLKTYEMTSQSWTHFKIHEVKRKNGLGRTKIDATKSMLKLI